MKIPKIDMTPPNPTGDSKADVERLTNYLNIQLEKMNYILTQIEKELNNV